MIHLCFVPSVCTDLSQLLAALDVASFRDIGTRINEIVRLTAHSLQLRSLDFRSIGKSRRSQAECVSDLISMRNSTTGSMYIMESILSW